MSEGLFGTFITTPLYNGIVFLLDILPGGNLGVAIIIFTCIVRFLLFPLAQKSVRTQILMQEIQPEVDEIREKYKNDPQQQAALLMSMYREKGLNPFASVLFLLIQLPIIIGLYLMFLKSGLPMIDPDFLYSFVQIPESVDHFFLGVVDLTIRSIPLAVLTGFLQFMQARLMRMPEQKPDKEGEKISMGKEFTKSLHFQMKYVFPIIITFVAFAVPASLALYWATSNAFSIGQELWMRKKLKGEGA